MVINTLVAFVKKHFTKENLEKLVDIRWLFIFICYTFLSMGNKLQDKVHELDKRLALQEQKFEIIMSNFFCAFEMRTGKLSNQIKVIRNNNEPLTPIIESCNPLRNTNLPINLAIKKMLIEDIEEYKKIQ